MLPTPYSMPATKSIKNMVSPSISTTPWPCTAAHRLPTVRRDVMKRSISIGPSSATAEESNIVTITSAPPKSSSAPCNSSMPIWPRSAGPCAPSPSCWPTPSPSLRPTRLRNPSTTSVSVPWCSHRSKTSPSPIRSKPKSPKSSTVWSAIASRPTARICRCQQSKRMV